MEIQSSWHFVVKQLTCIYILLLFCTNARLLKIILHAKTSTLFERMI